MIYKYEIACREAGLSEETTAEIRKFFDAEKKKLKRHNVILKKNNVNYRSVDATEWEGIDSNFGSYDIEDTNMNVENLVIEKIEMDLLKNCMEELSQEEQEFLLACFDGERGTIMKLAKELGIPQTTISSRKKRLFERVKKSFLEKYEKN